VATIKDVRKIPRDQLNILAGGVHRAHDALVAQAAEFGRGVDLDATQLTMIHALGLQGEMRMGELAERVVVGASRITRNAKKLEERGLVARQRSTRSEREVLISLTPEGEALFQQSFGHLVVAHQQYFDERFTENEQRTLAKLLKRV
jgi:DNA-binding MarR family transcriptional regulator